MAKAIEVADEEVVRCAAVAEVPVQVPSRHERCEVHYAKEVIVSSQKG